jgi:aminoglycoside phosphotransferase (APT) family kinase protein
MTLDRALARLGRFSRGITPLRALRLGPLKSSYLVARGAERFVVRIDHSPAAALGLDRAVELRVLQTAAHAAVAPEPVAWEIRAPAILVTRYVAGRNWRPADLRDGGRLAQLGALLRRVHGVAAPDVPVLDLGRALRRYARQAAVPEAREIVADAQSLLVRLQPRCDGLCHHDPIAANIVGFRRPMLIDWEYAGQGDLLFDFAVLIRHHGLPASRLRALCGRLVPSIKRRLEGFEALYDRVRLLWLLALQREAGLSPRQQAELSDLKASIGRPLRPLRL